jgi:hypothetical protein
MIALGSDYLLFQTDSGESVPLSAGMISVELMGETDKMFDSEFVRQAANAVFFYFKHELGRQTVLLGEFAGALEKVLRGFALSAKLLEGGKTSRGILKSDLALLASQSGDGRELFFFPRLRDELRAQLSQSPRLLHFSGLRGCIKQLLGARRWSLRCRNLQDQIVAYLRQCLTAEPTKADLALLVN